MGRERLPTREAGNDSAPRLDEGRSARAVAPRSGPGRRSVGQVLKRLAASGPDRQTPLATERDPAPAEQIGRFLRAARGAFSDSTERALESDLAIYAEWVRGTRGSSAARQSRDHRRFRRRQGGDARGRPRCAATSPASPSPTGRSGLEGTVKDPLVKLCPAAHAPEEGTAARRQATGLTWPLRQRMLEAAGATLRDDRNRAMLAVAYDAMLRRSELVSLQATDMLEEFHGDGSLLVRRSKTDFEGRGEIVWVSRNSVRLVRTWLDRAGISDGRLFRSVARGGRIGEGIHPGHVPRIFKAMARKADLPESRGRGPLGAQRTGRCGPRTWWLPGVEIPAILQAGRWKSVAMVNRYGERLLAKRSGAAQLARIQGRD